MIAPSLSIEQFARVVGEINAASLDPSRWPRVMDHLSGLYGSIGTHLLGYDFVSSPAIPGAFSAIDPEFATSYVDHYWKLNPWPASLVKATGSGAKAMGALVPPEVLHKTEFYNDWLKPQGGLSAGGGTMLFNEANRICLFGAVIPNRDQDRLEESWLGLVDALTPFLKHALEVSRMLAGLRLDAHILRNGIAPDQAAVAVITRDRRIASANPHAWAMIETGQPMAADMVGRLRLAAPQADDRLNAAMQRTAHPANCPPFEVEDRQQRRYICRLLPLDTDTSEVLPFPISNFAVPPLTVVILQRTSTTADLATRIGRQLGLSRGEAEIALSLASGLTPREIAEARQVSFHTVRNQIKSALSKSGARRQSELVALVERLRHGT